MYKKKKYPKGGELIGSSHAKGGILIEAEGGEIIINKNKNNASGKHKENLLALNQNPDDYEIVKKHKSKDSNYTVPVIDATKRRG